MTRTLDNTEMHAMDARYSGMVEEMRRAGKMRDGLARDVKRSWAPIPMTSDPKRETIKPCDSLDVPQVWAHSRMLLRWRMQARKWDASQTAQATHGMAQVYVVKRGDAASVIHLSDLTHEERLTIKWYLDIITRESVTVEERAALNQHAAAITTDGKEGMAAIRETRVNTRGAYGKRGVKVQPGTKVSQRDNRLPTMLLKPLVTVGVATHPQADVRDYSTLILAVRSKPTLSTVRVYHGYGPMTAQEAVNGRGTIKAVSDYGLQQPRATRHYSATQMGHAHTRGLADIRPDVDVLRYASIVGTHTAAELSA